MYALVEVEMAGFEQTREDAGTGQARYACVLMRTDEDGDAPGPTPNELDDLIQFGVALVGAQGGGAFVMPLQAHTGAGS